MSYKIQIHPFDTDLDTKPVMKKVAAERSALAEMKDAAKLASRAFQLGFEEMQKRGELPNE